jgi:hypothetical protein
VTLRVRVNTYNDTSILVEKTFRGRTEVLGYIESRKPVFISDAEVTGYTTSLVTGHQANLTISVFNSGITRTPGALSVIASSYTSLKTPADTEEVTLPASLPRNETWTFTVPLGIGMTDVGKPSFVVELYENSGTSPTDTMTITP